MMRSTHTTRSSTPSHKTSSYHTQTQWHWQHLSTERYTVFLLSLSSSPFPPPSLSHSLFSLSFSFFFLPHCTGSSCDQSWHGRRMSSLQWACQRKLRCTYLPNSTIRNYLLLYCPIKMQNGLNTPLNVHAYHTALVAHQHNAIYCINLLKELAEKSPAFCRLISQALLEVNRLKDNPCCVLDKVFLIDNKLWIGKLWLIFFYDLGLFSLSLSLSLSLPLPLQLLVSHGIVLSLAVSTWIRSTRRT